MAKSNSTLGLAAPEMNLAAYPNPGNGNSTIKYSVDATSQIKITVMDMQGKLIKVLSDKKQEAGVYNVQWDNGSLTAGTYLVIASKNGVVKQTIKVVKN